MNVEDEADDGSPQNIQVDIYGIKTKFVPGNVADPKPKDWDVVRATVNSTLMRIVVNSFELANEVLISGRRLIRGISRIPNSVSNWIEGAHSQIDEENERTSRDPPPIGLEEAMTRVSVVLAKLRDAGVEVASEEVTGKLVISIGGGKPKALADEVAKCLPALPGAIEVDGPNRKFRFPLYMIYKGTSIPEALSDDKHCLGLFSTFELAIDTIRKSLPGHSIYSIQGPRDCERILIQILNGPCRYLVFDYPLDRTMVSIAVARSVISGMPSEASSSEAFLTAYAADTESRHTVLTRARIRFPCYTAQDLRGIADDDQCVFVFSDTDRGVAFWRSLGQTSSIAMTLIRNPTELRQIFGKMQADTILSDSPITHAIIDAENDAGALSLKVALQTAIGQLSYGRTEA